MSEKINAEMKTELCSCSTSLKADPTIRKQKHSKDWTLPYSKEWTLPCGILCEEVGAGRNWFLVDNMLVTEVLSPCNIVHFGVIAYAGLKWMKHLQEAEFPNQQFFMHIQQRCQQLHTESKTEKDQAPGTGSGWHMCMVVVNWLQMFSHL